MGVFEHGFTYADLRARGIHTTPIPLSQALDDKFDKNGDISRYKTRLPLAEHAGNMKKGVHFKETYAPTCTIAELITPTTGTHGAILAKEADI